MLKCFVIIRKDILSAVQCGVQGAHALAELVSIKDEIPAVDDWVKHHKTLIFLAGTDEDFANAKVLYHRHGLKYADFLEPDLGNIITATAFEPIDRELGKKIFGHLKLI